MSNSTYTKQIFQTGSPARWNRFKWTTRTGLALLLIAISIVAITVYSVSNPSLPQLRDRNIRYQTILHPRHGLSLQHSVNGQYRDFRSFIKAEYRQGRRLNHAPLSAQPGAMDAPVRAGFYVNWDAQSLISLRSNLPKLNMVLPEWFFIDPSGDSIRSSIDVQALRLMQQSGVRIVPMLSNYIDSDFNGQALHRLLSDNQKMDRVISQAAALVRSYHFAGINIDFEELSEKGDEPIVRFMQRLHQSFGQQGWIVTQDVAPYNEDYNLRSLADANDYIFLMAYDQHQTQTDPGPVGDQSWIEKAVEQTTSKIPARKLVLCVAAYGYDWPANSKGEDLTYAEAVTTARESGAKPVFDTASYNVHYSYYDDNDHPHQVWFTDAASAFNSLRFAADYGLAGASVWRLGSEDSRIWKFWNKDLSESNWESVATDSLSTVRGTNDVDYQGEGEILDVVSAPQPGHFILSLDTADGLIRSEEYDTLPSSYVVRKYGKGTKQIVLTFDDGPDPEWTPKILDILAREHVPASFFLVGINAENNIPLVKRIYREGYEIGNHSFTHPNMAVVSTNRALIELNATRLLIECITGHSTILFRPPYNADAEPTSMQELGPVAFSKEHHYLTVGESIDPEDWEEGISADSIFARVVRQQDAGNIVLLHDAGGNRAATVAALPRIIEYFKAKGYAFTTIATLTNQPRESLMPAVPKGKGYYLIQLNYWLATVGYWLSHLLFNLFLFCLVSSILRLLLIAFLAWKEKRRSNERPGNTLPTAWPRVTVIVPAYNEEVNAVASLKRLLELDYPDFDVIFVDDGSKDETLKRVTDALGDETRLRILSKPNGGKASALNYGLAHTDAPIVLCIDADTQLRADVLKKLIPHFEDEHVAAVAGNVRVGNRINLLTRWQHIEYITSQNFDRRAFAWVNAIGVVPGALGAFRRVAINAAGGFMPDTFAEDCDLTLRLLRSGYRVTHENSAYAFTEAPERLSMFLRQRFRWTFGVMQAFWKHREAIFRQGSGSLGWIVLPNILFFQILIPLLAPFADLFLFIGLLTGQAKMLLGYYLVFLLTDLSIGLMAFIFERERKSALIWLLPQRLIYRWLMLYVLFKAVRRALRGELQSWGVLKRSGKIQLDPATAF